ncbi:MAG: FAD-binding oxidoreductase [Candidatus Acidiferrales bacterium]
MNAPAKILPSRIAEIVGTANLICDDEELAAYEVDGMLPGAAARPGTSEEVAELARFAAAEKLAIFACGARTKLSMGMPPERYDLAVDMTRMNRIAAYDPGDLTLGVEAGIGLAQVAKELEEHGQFLPLAVPWTAATTVGGTIASGVDSPLRQFYGTARDYVLGMEFVTGEGVLTKSGGRVVKNVTGYDLHKLMIGALGTLGIITRVNFKTFPLPHASRGFLAAFATAEAALGMRRSVSRSAVPLLTLEILSPELAKIFATRSPTTLGVALEEPGAWFPQDKWIVAAAYGGTERVLERCESELKKIAAECAAEDVAVLGDNRRPKVWGRLRECFAMLQECSPATTIFKISALPAEVQRFLPELKRAAEACQLAHATLVRGVGIIYFALLPEESRDEAMERLELAARDIFDRCTALGASAIIPWCPLELKKRVNIWGAPRADFALMQKVKQVFDPRGLFSPGRFAGGL